MKTTTKHQTRQCPCGGARVVLDSMGRSSTARCVSCNRCCLVAMNRIVVELQDFHLKRRLTPNDDRWKRPLDDLQMAKELVQNIEADVWPSPAKVLDFGIESSSHLGALQHAVRAGVGAYELDRVMGDGPAITELVKCVSPNNPYRYVIFRTVYDTLAWQLDECPEENDEER